ncbi:ABC transporter substrate-binding protein [Kalamiella sp. sgz302252]|uniref:ABC transporter substrate-binding protein n=1 Tax=Pantoea sp. sgz302252 TaxID=3341827 RepID=UPI0036D31B8C
MIKIFIIRVVLALFAMVSLAQAESLHAIRIGVPDQSAGSQPFIAGPIGMAYMRHQLEAAFKPQQVTIEWQFFKSAGPAVNEALANRQLDFVWLGDLAAIIGKASGLSTRLLLGSRGSESYLAVRKSAGIKGLADLRGKRVAVYRGTADQLAFDRALQSAGLNERSMQVINLDWNAGKAALAAGRIDAVWGGVALLALRGDNIDIVAKSSDSGRRNTTQAALLGSEAFINAWPEATQQLVDILVKNAAEISEAASRETWSAEMARQSQIPQALFLQELRPQNLNFMTSPRADAFLQESLRGSVEQAEASRLIRRAFNVEEWIEKRFVEQALEKLHLQNRWPLYNVEGMAETGAAD